MNPSVARMLIGKTESEAIAILTLYDCLWRVIIRDGRNMPLSPNDRDDRRYNLILRNGRIERVTAG